ncbi:MAG: RuBisCO large subunit C-terminal-like domain-containing protein, partial [Nanoarchaeota archaeon]
PQLNPFEERLVKTLQMKRRAESELGRKLLFAPNITAETAEMIRRADLAKDHKNDIVLVDVSAVGFASLQSVRRHCHQYILATRPYLADLSEQGIDRTVIAKLARLSGADIYADAGCSVENLDSIKRLHSIMWNAFPSDDLLATGIIHADEAVYDHPDDMFSGVKAMKQTMDAKKEGVFVKEFAKRHRELDKALMKWG